jgi:hypothetical protein
MNSGMGGYCENCGNPEPRHRTVREYRYRQWGLPWMWVACDDCSDEMTPRLFAELQHQR